MIGELLVHSQHPAAIAGVSKESHEPTGSRFIAGVEPNRSTDRLHFCLTRALELACLLPRGGPQCVT